MKTSTVKIVIAALAFVAVILVTNWAVQRYRKPGQLDLISAQAMDMSQMRPPVGMSLVSLSSVRRGSLDSTVTYTGTVVPYNEQDISPRIVGTLVSLAAYPGDTVHAGQVVAQLDTTQVGPQANEAAAQARQAEIGAHVADLTSRLKRRAEYNQASDQVDAAQQSVLDAQAEAQADSDAVGEAESGVRSAAANAVYWKTEIAREKQLADAGAVSQQDYQNETAQAVAAASAVTQAQSKVGQARATARSAQAKVKVARRQVAAAEAGVGIAQADTAVAQEESLQAAAGAAAAQASAQAAFQQQGYARIISPFTGVVTSRPVSPGTLVQPGMVVLKVAELDRVRIQANVAVEDMNGIRIGSPVQVAIQGDASQGTVYAHVTSVFPSANGQSRTAIVEAIVPNPQHKLLPGAFVTMTITKDIVSDTLLVPAGAVISEAGQSYLWVASGGAGTAAGPTYECVICHIHYTAAQAKRFHYRDPMEGGKLVPLASSASNAAPSITTVHRVAIQVGASDGVNTEVTSSSLSAGDRVVVHGQAGLSDGASVDAVTWGVGGPKTLPTAAESMGNESVYRCEKCGMTFSAADAKRDHYIDPMDGGRLVAVKPRRPSVTPSSGGMSGMKM